MAHVERAPHKARFPSHITLRCVREIPDLRAPWRLEQVVGCIGVSQKQDFRIVHYSVQSDHLHLLVEADEEQALVRGLRSFIIRVARRFNGLLLDRKGPFWADRYHRHDLTTPREVRHALVYVLGNGVKHGKVAPGERDPCSSAAWFTGWINAGPLPPGPGPVRAAKTWLLETGWTKVFPGFLSPSEVPRAAR